MDNIDPASLNLILTLQLEDLEMVERTTDRKGKGRVGEKSDFIVALDAYHAELISTSQVLTDRAMSYSIARAVLTDAKTIRGLQAQEELAARDRAMAVQLSGQKSAGVQQKGQPRDPVNSELLAKLEALWVGVADNDEGDGGDDGNDNDDSLPQAESATWAASRRTGAYKSQKGMTMCVACNDKFHDVETLKCRGCTHEYCRECLSSLFRGSLTDETLFPPRCCGNSIPVDECRGFIGDQLLGHLEAKRIEFETPAGRRTYCHAPTCSTFIPAAAIKSNIARCVLCDARTCAVCKKAAHANSDCPDDPSTQALLDLASAEGWQKCFSCSRLVELKTGCNHISRSARPSV